MTQTVFLVTEADCAICCSTFYYSRDIRFILFKGIEVNSLVIPRIAGVVRVSEFIVFVHMNTVLSVISKFVI